MKFLNVVFRVFDSVDDVRIVEKGEEQVSYLFDRHHSWPVELFLAIVDFESAIFILIGIQISNCQKTITEQILLALLLDVLLENHLVGHNIINLSLQL